ncbi:TBPIP-domain-containing protein [Coniophora puteana RWD-64-598 SS2]|uniref:TBPIP-domain-containing protein n=1 Tax=Coniophora puteana (strain RWD-64-598) TaxID=741705 RepID=A0A5M3N0L3_CONPW|nr:TBPIP-domain-containing protein [Coniophora puteana RWD-64-598 SS2]EIW84431.1 TBPIP-domain-containing protein [Coniophora puteana RWD-64-598 SS2]
MATKAKTEVKVLKGKEAEDAVLQYMKRMNRPFGAVDVAANLKGAVPKATVQKILVALAEKGDIVQKLYAKTSFFVANQSSIEGFPPERLTAMEDECKALNEKNDALNAEVKATLSELAKLRTSLTDEEIAGQQLKIDQAVCSLVVLLSLDLLYTTLAQISEATKHLEPLRSGAPPISEEEVAQLDTDWVKWRAEWVRRRKVFNSSVPRSRLSLSSRLCVDYMRPLLGPWFWGLATEALPPQDALDLREDLGIELDSDEHRDLEATSLCSASQANSLKRKRR